MLALLLFFPALLIRVASERGAMATEGNGPEHFRLDTPDDASTGRLPVRDGSDSQGDARDPPYEREQQATGGLGGVGTQDDLRTSSDRASMATAVDADISLATLEGARASGGASEAAEAAGGRLVDEVLLGVVPRPVAHQVPERTQAIGGTSVVTEASSEAARDAGPTGPRAARESSSETCAGNVLGRAQQAGIVGIDLDWSNGALGRA